MNVRNVYRRCGAALRESAGASHGRRSSSPRAEAPRTSPCSIDSTPLLRQTISYAPDCGHETFSLRSACSDPFLFVIRRLLQSAVLLVRHRKAAPIRLSLFWTKGGLTIDLVQGGLTKFGDARKPKCYPIFEFVFEST
jgi:hypothetical protein